jgi:arginine N-succinyltransferase
MVANSKTTDFRATVTSAARYLPAQNRLEVPESLARSLDLEVGTEVWFADPEAVLNQNPALATTCSPKPVKEAFRAH